jgi:hypothetical protein
LTTLWATLGRAGHAGLELHFARAPGVFDSQLAGGERHHDVVVGVDVVAGFGAGGETPFGDEDAVGLDLGMRSGFHVAASITCA